MFTRLYKVEIIITPKDGERYSIFRRKRLTRKEAKALNGTRRCGLYDLAKPYRYMDYIVTRL